MSRIVSRLLTLPAVVALASAAVTGIVLTAYPGPDRAAFGPGPGDEPVMDPVNAARSADLDARRAVVERRRLAKENVVARLIDGRLTFAEATAEFARLNADSPASLANIRAEYPGATDEELTARTVLVYAAVRVPADGAGAIMSRLEREFAVMYGHPASAGKPVPVPPPTPHVTRPRRGTR